MKRLRDAVNRTFAATQGPGTPDMTREQVYECLENLRQLTQRFEWEAMPCLELSSTYVEIASMCRRIGDTGSQRRQMREALNLRRLCIGIMHPSSVALAEEFARLH